MDINAWWDGLSNVLKILYCITLPATLFFLLQIILTLVGLNHVGGDIDISDTSGIDFDTDFDVHTDIHIDVCHHSGDVVSGSADLRLFTMQTFIVFFTVGGWTSIACISTGTENIASIVMGAFLGVIAMLVVALMVKYSSTLNEDGTVDIKNALGQTATVYIPIPSSGNGMGKITISLQGRFSEYDACTMCEESISVGTKVRVIDLEDSVMVVEPSDK